MQRSNVDLLLRLHLLEFSFQNIKKLIFKSYIWLSMTWIACSIRSSNHWVCNSIKSALCLREASIFINLTRSSFILLSKICSKCSMRNSEKRIYFRIKRTFFFENSSQNNRESSLTSNLQSIKSRRLIKSRKTQERRVWINSFLRNRFALLLLIVLRSWLFHHTKCLTFSVLIQWSIISEMKSSKSHMLAKVLRVNFALLRCFFDLRLKIFTFVAFVSIKSTLIIICISIHEQVLKVIRRVNSWEQSNSRFETKLRNDEK